MPRSKNYGKILKTRTIPGRADDGKLRSVYLGEKVYEQFIDTAAKYSSQPRKAVDAAIKVAIRVVSKRKNLQKRGAFSIAVRNDALARIERAAGV